MPGLVARPFNHATHGWVKKYQYPPAESTYVAAGLLLPQIRSNDTSVHTYLCGKHLFKVKGTYDEPNDKIIDTSVEFNVPFFGHLLLCDKVTHTLSSPLRIKVLDKFAPITGYIELKKSSGDDNGHVALGYDLKTPYGPLSDTLPLFPMDPTSLKAKPWYKDIPIMDKEALVTLRATPQSSVKPGDPEVGYRHVVLDADESRIDGLGDLLSGFLSGFTDVVGEAAKILIPALPALVGLDEPASTQKTIRTNFLNFLQIIGSFDLDTHYVNAALSLQIPIKGQTEVVRIRGKLDGPGVAVAVEDPIARGVAVMFCETSDAGAKGDKKTNVYIYFRLLVALVGQINSTPENYPLLEL